MGNLRRRRLRQRGRDDDGENVGASDSSSDADVEFIGIKSDDAAASALDISGRTESSVHGSDDRAGGVWACPRCTFVNEDAQAKRCEMCDSARAEDPPRKKTRKMSQWLERSSQPSARRTPAKEARKAKELGDSSSDEDGDAALASRYSTGRSAQQKTKRIGNDKSSAVKTPAELWAEAYAPSTVGDLCINKKKVEELREWMARNASPTAADSAIRQHPPRQRLLFLCGPPGAGKSTAVRCIARELGLAITEWGDNESAGRLNYDRMLNSEFQTPYVSSLNDFADFIRQSVSYSALPLVAVSRRRARSVKAESRSATTEDPSRLHKKRRFPGGSTGAAFAPVTSPTPSSGHVILIENWPETWSRDQKAASEGKLQQIFRQIVDPGAQYRGFPVVCIYSDVRDSKVAVDQLSHKFSADVARSPYTAVMNINAVTTAVLKKHLARVIEQERCKITQRDIDTIVATANGDIRHTLNMLQMAHNRVDGQPSALSRPLKSSCKKRKQASASKVKTGTSDGEEPNLIGRDAFLSDFRVLGKILYGKTLNGKAASSSSSSSSSSSQPVDYEAMIAASGMSVDRALAFVHENGIAYFSAIEDLSEAMELMSVTENIVATSYSGMGNSEVFKRTHDIAQSILIRSIAVTNKNPERAGFRPITGPRMYATNQRMVSRRDEWLQRSSLDEPSALHHQYVCSGDAFLFEVEPFLSVIEANAPRDLVAASRRAPQQLPVDLTQLKVEMDDEIESSDGEAW